MADFEHFRLVLESGDMATLAKLVKLPFTAGLDIVELPGGDVIIRVSKTGLSATAANTGSATDDILVGSKDSLSYFEERDCYAEAYKTTSREDLCFLGWAIMVDHSKISPETDKDDYDVDFAFYQSHDGEVGDYDSDEANDRIHLYSEVVDAEAAGIESVQQSGPFLIREAVARKMNPRSSVKHYIGVETEVRRHDNSAFTAVTTATFPMTGFAIFCTENLLKQFKTLKDLINAFFRD